MKNHLAKKALCLALSAAVCLSLCACGATPAEAPAPSTAPVVSEKAKLFSNPGTYTASATGKNGEIQVSVSFSEDAIVSIDYVSEETPTIGNSAMDSLKETILKNQSLNVDVVSGATLSSQAFIDAVNDTVMQAGGDLEALGNAAIALESETYKTTADIIIVGAGGAGLTAAVEAANAGADVILLEKSNSVGGNTLCAANGINAYNAQVQLNDDAYNQAETSEENMLALHKNDLNKTELIETYIENSAAVIDYFESLGIEFTPEISSDERNKTSNPYLLKANADGSTAITMINAINTELEKTDVTLYKQMEATALIQDETGAVIGVKATDASGSEIEFNAKAVILCTGGFGKNAELIAQVNPKLAGVITDEQAPTTGQGLLMAQAIGAGTQDLDQIQTFPSVIEGSGMFMSFGLWGSGDAISVNKSGERFSKEQFENVPAVLSQEGSIVYGIFDADNYRDNYETLITNGFMFKASSIEELADMLGIDAENLKATIDKWNNDAANGGVDSVYGRENITAIDGDVYYGYAYGVGAHYFMGGLTINEKTQVLDVDGNVIPGLYAAGEVTGGFHGSQRVDGSGTGDSFIFGYVAGREVAAAVK